MSNRVLKKHIKRSVISILITAVVAVSIYAGYVLWSYAPWITSHELRLFDYSRDRAINWENELGDITIPEKIADWKESPIITHAMGRIDQYALTNSKEALMAHYSRGARVFEVDLTLTTDKRLVCVHDWESFMKSAGIDNVAANRTFAVFMQTKIHGKYTPLSFRDLAMMMKHCPDVFIVTDTKSDRPHLIRQTFAALVADAKSVDETILDRVIPQLYVPSMLTEIERIYPFKEYIFTRYKRGSRENQILDLIERHPNVTGVTFPKGKIPPLFCEQLKGRNVRTYTHTVNSIEDIKRYAALGIDGFYSDDLTENDVRNYK